MRRKLKNQKILTKQHLLLTLGRAQLTFPLFLTPAAGFAFATVTSLQTNYAIQYLTTPPSLSNQQALSCSYPAGTNTCGSNVGTPIEVLKSALTTSAAYPYTNGGSA